MTEPLPDFSVNVGGTYWAAYGDKRWSAVRVISKGYKHARVERVKPHDQSVVNRKGKCRLDEMVKRDPKLKGKDKPERVPSEVFARGRELRAQDKAEKEAKAAPPPEPKPQPRAALVKLSEAEAQARAKRVAALFDLFDDDSTIDDW